MSFNDEYKPQNETRGQGRADIVEEAPFIDTESGVNATREDRETAQSEATGRIPQSEIDDLRANAGGQTTKSRTRGIRNDAMRQEREVDEAIENSPEDKY